MQLLLKSQLTSNICEMKNKIEKVIYLLIPLLAKCSNAESIKITKMPEYTMRFLNLVSRNQVTSVKF